jgi:hypothetical protein
MVSVLDSYTDCQKLVEPSSDNFPALLLAVMSILQIIVIVIIFGKISVYIWVQFLSMPTLNVSDINSIFGTIAMFVVNDWQTIFHKQEVDMFMIYEYIHTEHHTPNSNCSLVNIVRVTTKRNLGWPPCCNFTLFKMAPKKSTNSSNIFYDTWIQYLGGADVASTSKFRTSSISYLQFPMA